MPNFDTGHYFLTVLAPIKNGDTHDDDIIGHNVEKKVSYRERLRFMLSTLPTAFQSPATEWNPQTGQHYQANSPFAKCHRTHLCRFVMIDDAVYNGRNKRNALMTALKEKLWNISPITPEETDHLSHAYLMFSADFDAIKEHIPPLVKKGEDRYQLPQTLSKDEQEAIRDDYARSLWDKMAPELTRLFENCEHFDATKGKQGFVDYIKHCQVETTMPFNDYWYPAPDDKKNPPGLYAFPLNRAIAIIAILLVLFMLSLFLWSGSTKILLGAGVLAAIFGTYHLINRKAQNPMPAGKMASLRHVLKSLYLGKHFRNFIIDNQTRDDESLFQHFGQFVEQHKPNELNDAATTQVPGVIGRNFRTPTMEQAQ